MNNRISYLAKNVGILAVSNFSSKILEDCGNMCIFATERLRERTEPQPLGIPEGDACYCRNARIGTGSTSILCK